MQNFRIRWEGPESGSAADNWQPRVSNDADLMAKSGWHWKMERTVRGLNVHEFTKTMDWEEKPRC